MDNKIGFLMMTSLKNNDYRDHLTASPVQDSGFNERMIEYFLTDSARERSFIVRESGFTAIGKVFDLRGFPDDSEGLFMELERPTYAMAALVSDSDAVPVIDDVPRLFYEHIGFLWEEPPLSSILDQTIQTDWMVGVDEMDAGIPEGFVKVSEDIYEMASPQHYDAPDPETEPAAEVATPDERPLSFFQTVMVSLGRLLGRDADGQ